MLELDMLEAVLEEMNGDSEADVAEAVLQRPRADRSLPAADAVARVREDARQSSSTDTVGAGDRGLMEVQIRAIEQAFAERDRHLAALRQEVEALGAAHKGAVAPADIDARLTRIEERLDEQENSLRHVLTMMIEYFKSQGTRAAA